MSLEIRSSVSTYPVFLDDASAMAEALNNGSSIFLVDGRVWSLYRDGALKSLEDKKLLLITATEKSKEFKKLGGVFKGMLARGARKNVSIVAIGGGVVQDIAGFVASTLFRGVPWSLLPTTLLAQADSCIGAKSSINLGPYKNQIGSFYPPRAIHISTAFLGTLSTTDLQSGLGEIAKLAIIDGEERWQAFQNSLPALLGRDRAALSMWIGISLGIKKRFIEEDEFDKGIRNYLNFGHCFGHAIESATKNRISHGQAVSLGIVLADMLAINRGLITDGRMQRHKAVIDRMVDTDFHRLALNERRIIEAMGKDKKRTGAGFAVIVSREDGQMQKLDDVRVEEVIRVLRKARENT